MISDLLKCCHVSHVFYPYGGDPFGLRELTRILRGLGNDVSVVSWAVGKNSSVAEYLDGNTVIRLRGINARIFPTIVEYPYLIGLKDAISQIQPEVVNCQSHLFLPTLQAIEACRSLRIPMIVTVRGLFAKRGMVTNLSQWAYLLSICRSFLKRVDCIVCLTDYERKLVRSFGIHNRIEVIPNGVDLNLFHPATKKEANTISWVGRMVPEKGLEHLLMAMQHVIREVRDARLLLVGDGPMMPKLRNLASELGVDQNCVFLGNKSRVEVAQILSRSTVFAFPSLREGFPKAILEAMACGNVVVSSNLPQISEIIEAAQDGYFVDPSDHLQFASSIIACLQDTDFARRCESTMRRIAEERFNVEKIARKYEELYMNIATSHRN